MKIFLLFCVCLLLTFCKSTHSSDESTASDRQANLGNTQNESAPDQATQASMDTEANAPEPALNPNTIDTVFFSNNTSSAPISQPQSSDSMTTNSTTDASSGSLSGGEIGGIAVGGLAGVALLAIFGRMAKGTNEVKVKTTKGYNRHSHRKKDFSV